MNNNKNNNKVSKKKKVTYRISTPLYLRNYPLYFCLCFVSSIGLILLLGIVVQFVGNSIIELIKKISKLDAVIIVALITGFFTIFTEIISKILTKHQEKKFFILQKREFIYKQIIELYYLIQEHVLNNEILNNEEIYKISKTFQNDLLLWAPNKLIYTWSNFCKHIDDTENLLINIEKVIRVIRKDITNISLEKGVLLSIRKSDKK